MAAPDTSAVTVRMARDEDAGPIAELWTAVYVRSGLTPRVQPFTVRDVRVARSQGDLFAADLGGRIVGAVALVAHGTPLASVTESPAEAQVCLLAVADSARRSGIGRLLLESCTVRAAERGRTALVLWTRPPQRTAHRRYEELGYQRVPCRDSAPGGYPRLTYRLVLR